MGGSGPRKRKIHEETVVITLTNNETVTLISGGDNLPACFSLGHPGGDTGVVGVFENSD